MTQALPPLTLVHPAFVQVAEEVASCPTFAAASFVVASSTFAAAHVDACCYYLTLTEQLGLWRWQFAESWGRYNLTRLLVSGRPLSHRKSWVSSSTETNCPRENGGQNPFGMGMREHLPKFFRWFKIKETLRIQVCPKKGITPAFLF